LAYVGGCRRSTDKQKEDDSDAGKQAI
jgi:hypothetical protein